VREIRRILVANRGEIACRIFRTVRAMGLESVAVFSDADRDARHVVEADDAFHIGPAPAARSYMDIAAVLDAARRSEADAIHPGYGFLSENADFAEACTQAGLSFIGPPPAAIRAMGSKSASKTLMGGAGVPLVPGYHGEEQDDATLIEAANGIGFPVLIKASAGGGGRGMRIVRDAAELPAALASARREAKASFGDDRLLLERYLEHARHIEVQVFGDSHGNLVHLFERDCSVQRRYQKVIEEAPAPHLSDALRSHLQETALRAARAVDYVNAGTVEFIVSGEDAYFMEMNTRLQVEHPVTEAVTGLDLVEWQIRIARGEALPLTQDAIACSGHAIEARLYAEDPRRDFLPQTGSLRHVLYADDDSDLRVDHCGWNDVTPHYDALLAKIVAHGDNRAAALQRLQQALDETVTVGIATNRRYLERVSHHPVFVSGKHDTAFIPDHMHDLLPPVAAAPPIACFAAGLRSFLDTIGLDGNVEETGPGSPWALSDGWQANLAPRIVVCLEDETGRHEVTIRPCPGTMQDGLRHAWFDVAVDGEEPQRLRLDVINDPEEIVVQTETGTVRAYGLLDGSTLWLQFERQYGEDVPEEDIAFTIIDPRATPITTASGGGRLVAPMPGTVTAVDVAEGAMVKAGQTLVVVEAMKMEHAIKAPHDGTVSRVDCAVGDLVAEGDELVVLETAP